jgi:glycosyltransferase involved in cell wall biosynthesis
LARQDVFFVKPTVSIVMPCFNAAAHLRTSIGSVLEQTAADWELIVVDDGSIDDSWQVLGEYAEQDSRIRPIRQANAGAAAARNTALQRVQGDLVAFLDADDTWDSRFLATMQQALEADPAAGIAYCGWQNLGLPGGSGRPYVPPDYETEEKTRSLLTSCPWPIHAALVRTPVLIAAGGFDPQLSSCMDFDLWLRVGTKERLVRVPQVLAYYHHHGGTQITSNSARIALNHRRAQIKYLEANPQTKDALGRRQVRDLVEGELLRRGYAAYWKRDIGAARQIFREVMLSGYGKLSDWKYMLPALLPSFIHEGLIRLASSGNQPTDAK